MRFYFVTPVWGVNHLSLFLKIGLPSLLAPGNLPGLAQTATCRFIIYTRAEDEPRLRSASIFHRLAACMPVDVHLIPEPMSNPHRVMSDCHADSLRRADEDDAATVFIPPDCVWSDGSMVQVGRIAQSGVSMIHMSGIRLDRDAVVPRLREHLSAAGSILAISPRILVTLGLAHLHPIATSHFWNEHEGGLMPANLYWTVSGEGLALRCFHLHPLMVKPQIKFARFDSTIDDDLALFACPDASHDYVVTDSDEILAFELSGLERVVGADFQKGSVEAVASWAEVGTNARHHLLAQHPIRVHFGSVTEELWKPIEADGSRVIAAILHLNHLSSSVLALRYPAVLVWRYYAMTLNKGRYFGKSRPLSRLVIPLLRRLIHSNRRIYALFVNRDGSPRPWHPKRLFLRKISHRPAGPFTQRTRIVDPLAAAALQRRADAKRARGNWSGAIRYYDEAINVSPPNTALYYLRGTAHLETKDFASAFSDFEAALKLDPSSAPLQYFLQQARASLQQESASTVVAPALTAEFLLQADAKRAQSDLTSAIRGYDAAIRVSAPNAALYCLRGTALLEHRNLVGAILDFRAGLQLEPDNQLLRQFMWQAWMSIIQKRLHTLLFNQDGDLRLSHPMWLIHRSTLATLLSVIGPADRIIVLLGDDRRFMRQLERVRPWLKMTAIDNNAAAAWLAGSKASESEIDVIIILDLDSRLSDDLSVVLTSSHRRGKRLVCIRTGSSPVKLQGSPELLVEVHQIGGLGTYLYYSIYRLLKPAGSRLLSHIPLGRIAGRWPVKFITVLVLPFLVMFGVLNLFGLALDRLSMRATNLAKTLCASAAE